MTRTFRDRFTAHEALFGPFLKIPATMPAEVMGSVGFDFVVVDEEHAPFNRETTDRIILACRAAGLAAIVRVQSGAPENILSVLDCGADGVLVPHVTDAATARAIVRAGRYRGGSRGFSPTTRAGDFGGAGADQHMTSEDARVTIIAMIEDPEGVENIDDILAVEGLDGVFIGRADLAASYAGAGDVPTLVRDATARILSAAQQAGRPVAIMPGAGDDAVTQFGAGASMFIISSDQTLLRTAAAGALGTIKQALGVA